MTWEPPGFGERRQMEDAAFYEVGTRRGVIREPIDRHAAYTAVPRAAERLDLDCPVRSALRDKTYAVSVLAERHDLNHHPDDRVRLDGGSWMEVVDPNDAGFHDGPVVRYEDGSVDYVLLTDDWDLNGLDSADRMRRVDDYSSAGRFTVIEVEWGEDER